MKLLDKIKSIIYADNFVSEHKAEDEHRNQRGIALIAAAAFLVMSILNIKQRSIPMLLTTGISAVFLILGYLISRYKNNAVFLRVIFYIIFVVIFTAYTIMGGNDGFAALWLIVAIYAVMIAIDFKAGFIISVYYLMMLLLTFVGPLSPILQFEYNKTFLLRFPFLYAISFCFATYIVIRIRTYQYELLLKQQELENLSRFDLSTGLMNRNSFIEYEKSFQTQNLERLLVVFIDVNGLHEINNTEGHDAGDRMLCFIANICKQLFASHLVYRIGGDEFLILCKDIEENDVITKMQTLNDTIERKGYSISYGIEKQETDFDLNELVKCADTRMVESKREFYKSKERTDRINL